MLKADLTAELKRFLPYEVIENATAETDALQLSRAELAKYCERIANNNNITEIEHFAADVLKAGRQHTITAVMNFADQLPSEIDCFDLVAIKKSLNAYPKLQSRLSTRLEQ